MKSNSNISIYKPISLLAILFVISSYFIWPGVMSADGIQQYNYAVSGTYGDHHPPIMSFLWHYLLNIHDGPGLMLMFHLLMLYTAAAIFIYIFRNSKFKWWFAIYPIIPGILAYTPLIVKDVGLAYSFLLAGALLSYLITEKIVKRKWLYLSLVLLLLFYGTAVKYQARFILIFFCLGVSYCWFNYKHSWKSIIAGSALCLIILQAMFSFNNFMVPNTNKSHSWQLVKLYDLAAMSVALDKPLFPAFVQANPNFSMERVKNTFAYYEVDSLVFPPDSPLKGGKNDVDRATLLQYWKDTVQQHPWLYLKVRFRLWCFTINGTPAAKTNPAQFLATIPAFKSFVTQPAIYTAIGAVYEGLKISLQFTWLLPLLFLYCYLAISRINICRAATPLLIFSATSMVLLGILFFMSMYGTARYLFICICLIHASHGFAYRCFIKRET